MSAPTQLPSRLPPAGDRFALGHRYVVSIGPGGEEISTQVPLTPYDVLHPQEGDFIVQTDDHDTDCMYLKSVAKATLADDPGAIVYSDHRIDLGIPDVEPIGSDLAVFLGVIERKRPGGTFYAAEEGVHPSLIVEVTSPETRKNDLGIKKEYYHRAEAGLYVIVDTKDREKKGILRLIGYRWAPDDWVRMEPNDKGWLWLAPLNLWIGIVGTQIRFFDIHGNAVGDYTEIAQELADTAQLAADLGQLVDEEKQRADEEKQRADEEKRRADEAEQRANAEAQKRLELEQRLRDIEEKLSRPTTNGHGPSNGE